MKKLLIFCCMCVLGLVGSQFFSSCQSCGDKRVKDVSDIPGVYAGQAELLIPDGLKKMIPDSLKGMVPEGPIPARLRIKENAEKKLEVEILDFKMPKEGMELKTATCEVSQEGEAFNIEGEGKVKLDETKELTYTHEGKIEGTGIQMKGTIYILPPIIGVNIMFNGEKQ